MSVLATANLILATSGVQSANGFFGTLISLPVAIEDFEASKAGLVLSSYFAGFALSAAHGSSSASGTSAPMPRSPG